MGQEPWVRSQEPGVRSRSQKLKISKKEVPGNPAFLLIFRLFDNNSKLMQYIGNFSDFLSFKSNLYINKPIFASI
jgi:hypothetical protein